MQRLALEALGRLRLASESSAGSAGLALCFPAGSALCRELAYHFCPRPCSLGLLRDQPGRGRQLPCC